jgi:hypothetical protein
MSGLFTWSLFGSFYVKEVIGQKCGPETVIPCIMYDITRDVNILEEYRIHTASLTGLLLVISLIVLFKFSKQEARKS